MAGMDDSGPQRDPGAAERIKEAFGALARAITEIAESFQPVLETVARIAQDPRVQAAIAADRDPARPGCQCLCAAVHGEEMGICDGESAGTVPISGMDVLMCAPCQAARAASKLAWPG